MIPYPLRIKVIGILTQHRNKWLKTRVIAKKVGIITPDGISRISNVLYRLRHLPRIERKRDSHTFQYRYYEEITGHHTNIPPIPKAQSIKKLGGKNNHFDFIEELAENSNGYCEFCGVHTEIRYRAERDGCSVYLCKKHGDTIDKSLFGGYEGVEQ